MLRIYFGSGDVFALLFLADVFLNIFCRGGIVFSLMCSLRLFSIIFTPGMCVRIISWYSSISFYFLLLRSGIRFIIGCSAHLMFYFLRKACASLHDVSVLRSVFV